MKCAECGGEVNLQTKISLPIARGYDNAFACTNCGRLHWPEGKPVSNNQTKKKAYLVSGEVVARSMEARNF